MAIDKAELRKLAEKATKGPWSAKHIASGVRHLERNCSEWYFEDLPDEYNLPGRQNGDGGKADGEFIAASCEAIPALLDALDAAEERESVLVKAFYEAWALFDRFRMGVHPLESSQRWQTKFDSIRDGVTSTALRDENKRLRERIEKAANIINRTSALATWNTWSEYDQLRRDADAWLAAKEPTT